MKYRSLLPLIPAAVILAGAMFSHSCANTTQPPSGGPKDTIPPMLIAVSPMPGDLNVAVKHTKLAFKFNEYVTVKDPKALYLSPPLEKGIKSRIEGKSVIVYFDEELLPDRTYTMDISGAIGDNNEGNMFPGYVLTFSTGERIDSMYITGTVRDCNTLKPVKGATVMIYKDQRDSAIFLSRPDAAVKTDDWGYFCLRNIQDTCFRLYALMDRNSNNKYEPENDLIAFYDTVITPRNKVADGVYELYKFDMKDTLSCLKRKSEFDLNLFKGKPSKQMIVNKERVSERCSYITFMAPDVKIDSLWFTGISPKRIIKMFNPDRDSLVLWINSSKPQPDTLKLNVKYMKTDSTGRLRRTVEKVKLVIPKELNAKLNKYSKKEHKHEDSIAVYKANYTPETFEQDGIEIAFEYPLVRHAFDSLKYIIINPKQKKTSGKYTWTRDKEDLRIYHIKNVGKVLPGYEYCFTVPHHKFKDINGKFNDSLEVKIKLPDDDKLSEIIFNVHGTDGSSNYIIDIMTEKMDKVLRSYTISKDAELRFPYLKAGKYCLRITEDKNKNGRVDTGDLLQHKQPERVRFYEMKDGAKDFDVPESAEMKQDLYIDQLFK